MSKQYSIRTQDYKDSHIDEAVLDANDPIHEIKALAGLTNVGNLGRLQEYKGPESQMANQGSNPSITAMEKIDYHTRCSIIDIGNICQIFIFVFSFKKYLI